MRKAILLRISVFMLLMVSMQVAGFVQGQGVPGTEQSTVLVDTVNPLTDVILPRLYPIIALDVSPSLGDATLINRIRFVVALGMVDAAAPYHPTAVGMYTRVPRQPMDELPAGKQSPGISIWLDLGDYLDTTGYFPVNTAFQLRDPSRWQPGLRRMGIGVYTVQQFVTPQLANVEPFAPFNPRELRVAPPVESNPEDWEAYKEQVDVVLETLANLTDELKMKSELFDNKVASLGLSYLHVVDLLQLSPADSVRGYLLKAAAWMDAAIVTWQEKTRFDAVRPFSAIPYVYGDELVTSWGGPGEGRSELRASRWMSYLPENNHPEYPSVAASHMLRHCGATPGPMHWIGASAIRPARRALNRVLPPRRISICTSLPGQISPATAAIRATGAAYILRRQWKQALPIAAALAIWRLSISRR